MAGPCCALSLPYSSIYSPLQQLTHQDDEVQSFRPNGNECAHFYWLFLESHHRLHHSQRNTHTRKVTTDISTLLHAKLPEQFLYQRTLGRLVWLALLNIPLLSVFSHVFRHLHHISANTIVTVSDQCRRELIMACSLLPLASTSTNVPLSCTIIAFDASLTHGSVVAAHTTSALAGEIGLLPFSMELHRWLAKRRPGTCWRTPHMHLLKRMTGRTFANKHGLNKSLYLP